MNNTNEITPTGYTRDAEYSEGEHHGSTNGVYACHIHRSDDYLSITVAEKPIYRGNEASMATIVPAGQLTQATIDRIVDVLELHAGDLSLLSRNIEDEYREETDGN